MIAFTMKRYNSSGSLADSAFCTDLFTFLKPAQIPVYIIQNKKMGAETSGVFEQNKLIATAYSLTQKWLRMREDNLAGLS
jgi:hypothetical protein